MTNWHGNELVIIEIYWLEPGDKIKNTLPEKSNDLWFYIKGDIVTPMPIPPDRAHLSTKAAVLKFKPVANPDYMDGNWVSWLDQQRELDDEFYDFLIDDATALVHYALNQQHKAWCPFLISFYAVYNVYVRSNYQDGDDIEYTLTGVLDGLKLPTIVEAVRP